MPAWVAGTAVVVGVCGTAGAPAVRADPESPLLPLIDAAAQRLQTADAVAAYKYRTGGAVDDPKREQQVIDAVTAAAAAAHIDPGYVGSIFRNQIDATSSVEYTRFAQWKIDPGAVPASAPDLSETRTTIDRLNQTMVREMAAQWDDLHSPSCAVDRDAALSAVTASRALDPVYQSALAYATHTYCP
ncbi:chorismate mutase [Mycobacterium aquaticum]|uniref:Chorismate mutase n=1 Tax=Mycobacterium aquaticum TaxID=1927124 RepID=A0A1X0B0Z7_9MYCO|nr:chorismate mutase [Mycobacterium aquaticum]